MDGKTLPRIGAIAFVAIAITVAVIDMRRAPGSEAVAAPVVTVASSEPWRAELMRCQSIGQVGASDTGCLRAWAENRRRFLAPGTRAALAPPIETVVVPVSDTPKLIVNDAAAALPSDAGAR
ncbi:putative entry exclusion protein TrbK-alt [Sphingomonas sp. GB1N7]|uniref:putative entry exclusion protein TrbK-alt n=1 Tax=Parasphingomonas caseinilytica TaxID=3096158 RepID=UPI002FCB0278